MSIYLFFQNIFKFKNYPNSTLEMYKWYDPNKLLQAVAIMMQKRQDESTGNDRRDSLPSGHVVYELGR